MASVRYLGHSTFLAELGGRTILIDPWLSASRESMQTRLIPPAVTQDAIRKCDLILCTHEHHDHADVFDVKSINQRTGCPVVAPEETLALFGLASRFNVPVKAGDSFNLYGINVSVTPARHPQSIHPVGFVISSDREEKTLYHAGDTFDSSDFGRIDCDLAMLPIGGKFTMDVLSAATAVKRMRAKHVIPMHYNTFSAIGADVHDFALRVKNQTKTEPVVLGVGEAVTI
ncbi:MAG: metal-dependent hydrolase [Candidatus Micrarchaeota archaeon]